MNKEYKNIINKNLEKYIDSLSNSFLPNIIYESIKYSLLSNGKRIRAILFLETYKSFNNNLDLEELMPFCLSIEMIHTYSLIHDDLPSLDNDDFRRNKLSNHKVFGENIAILAGDALLNLSYEVIFDFCSTRNNIKYILAAKQIANASGLKGMISGQVVDIISEGKNIDEKTLLYMYENKTSKLIQASMISAAIIANAKKEYIEKIKKIGYLIGISFQIKDDLLDAKTENYNISSDIKNKKTTFVSIYGINKSEEYLKKYTEEAINILNEIDLDINSLKELISKLLVRKN